jgi:DNA-binding IclR family transcriptional regulator
MRSVDALRLTSNAVVGLAAELGLMVTVAVWGTFGATIVQVQEAADQVHVNLRAGAVYSVRNTATGRVFAAFLPQAVIKAHLDAEQRNGTEDKRIGDPNTAASFAKEVEQIKRLGYATAIGSPVPGINAISAPVFDHTGQMQLAITLIGPARLVDVRRGSSHVRRMTEFTAALSAELGYNAGLVPDAQVASKETAIPLVRPTKAKAPRTVQKRRA